MAFSFGRQSILPRRTSSATSVPQATMSLEVSSVAVTVQEGATTIVLPDTIRLLNTGVGTFSNPQVTGAAAWLTVTSTVDGTGFEYSFTVDATSKTAGTYTSTLTFTDANASNSGLTASVSLVVAAASVTMTVVPSSLSLSVVDETAAGTPVTSTITSAGGTPAVGTITGTGAAYVGTPVITGSAPTWTITVTPTATGGTVGTYTAVIPVLSSGTANSPVSLTIGVTVTAAGSVLLGMDRTIDDAAANVGDPNPPSEVRGILSVNGLPLAGPTIQSQTYRGSRSGWATPTLNGVTLTTAYDISGVDVAGVSYCDLVIADANASNTVAYTIQLVMGGAVAPVVLAASPTSVSSVAIVGSNASPVSVTVYNGGTGGLAALGTISASLLSTAWASVSLAPSTGVATVTFNASGLSVGTYTTTLRVAATGATNSPIDIALGVTILAATAGLYPVPTIPTPPSGYAWNATLGYPVGSVFNSLASYRSADNGAMPTFSGTEYLVHNQSDWATVQTNLGNGTIVDGDIITIDAGVTISQPRFPKRVGWVEGTSGFVLIRSSAHASLPAYGSANTPAGCAQAKCVDATRDAAHFAIFSTTTTGVSTIKPQSGAGGYWLTGINFYANTSTATGYNVILSAHVGDAANNGGATYQQTLADVPSCWVFDRCAFTANSGGAQNTLFCDGRYVRVVHCDLGHARYNLPSQRPECHSIVSYNTDGRHEIVGNKFSSRGIGILYGGANPRIPNYPMPDHTCIMWNRIWCPSDIAADYDTQALKNAMEWKHGSYSIFAFNDMRYFWLNPNQRYAILCKASANPPSTGQGTFPGRVGHIAVWCNRMRNSAKGLFAVADKEVRSDVALGCDHIEVGYNLQTWDPAYYSTYYGVPVLAEKRPWSFDRSGGDGVDTFLFHHNTCGGAHDAAIGPDSTTAGTGWRLISVRNNVHVEAVTYGPLFASGGDDSTILNARVGAGNWEWKRNYVGSGGTTWDATLAGGSNLNGYLTNADFQAPASDDYRLKTTTAASASFTGGGGGTDGRDCGYDHAYLLAMLTDIGD